MTRSFSLERWSLLMRNLGLASHADVFARLAAAYSEPHRHYHTAAHISACLDELDAVRELACFPFEVEAALWFHDAVYDTRASDNEERSAAWAAEFLAQAGAAKFVAERVRAHVLATQHDGAPGLPDSTLVVDIDLSILGQPPAVYDELERNVHEEYRWVPKRLYRRRRREILQSFLDRAHVYAAAFSRALRSAGAGKSAGGDTGAAIDRHSEFSSAPARCEHRRPANAAHA